MSHFRSKVSLSPHRLSYTFSHLCKLTLSTIIVLCLTGIWGWEFSLKPVSFASSLADFLLLFSWITSSLLVRTEFVKTGGTSKYLLWWWLIASLCEICLIPVRVETISLFAVFNAGELALLTIVGAQILLAVIGFIHAQDISNSNYFEFNLEQYSSEGEHPKPLEEVWNQFETVRQTDMEEKKKQEMLLQKELSMIREAHVPGYEIIELNRKTQVVYSLVTKRGKTKGVSSEVKRKYSDCLKFREYLQATHPGFKVPELPPLLAKGKKLKQKEINNRRVKLDRLMQWVTDLGICDDRTQSFFLDKSLSADGYESDPAETMDFTLPPANLPISLPAPEPSSMRPTLPTCVTEPDPNKLCVVVLGTFEGSTVLRRYAVYELAVSFGSKTQVIGKRFSEFKALDYLLRPKYSLPDFPNYSYIESSVDQEVVDSRKMKLQEYMNAVIDSDASTDKELLKFLNLA
mmetsp:Transcript_33981/g.59220  ORF Transcript_33981/g.59220 Transcript_33981/m.59220 type:complete len:460 (-) Transcript_33981:1776-3155(-)